MARRRPYSSGDYGAITNNGQQSCEQRREYSNASLDVPNSLLLRRRVTGQLRMHKLLLVRRHSDSCKQRDNNETAYRGQQHTADDNTR